MEEATEKLQQLEEHAVKRLGPEVDKAKVEVERVTIERDQVWLHSSLPSLPCLMHKSTTSSKSNSTPNAPNPPN
jgi:hypothetical protein